MRLVHAATQLALRLMAALTVAGARARLREERGESLMEYELLVGFLVVACIATMTRFGTQVHALADSITGAL